MFRNHHLVAQTSESVGGGWGISVTPTIFGFSEGFWPHPWCLPVIRSVEEAPYNYMGTSSWNPVDFSSPV